MIVQKEYISLLFLTLAKFPKHFRVIKNKKVLLKNHMSSYIDLEQSLLCRKFICMLINFSGMRPSLCSDYIMSFQKQNKVKVWENDRI